MWSQAGRIDSLREQLQSCGSQWRRSRKPTTDPLKMELTRKQARCQLARARDYRYKLSLDRLRVELLKLRPAGSWRRPLLALTTACPTLGDLLAGKGGARTKSIDLRNWLGCNGRSVFFWTFLGTPDRRTTLALAQSQPVVVIVSRSPPSWPNQLVLALLKCFPEATLGGTRPQKGVRALWLLKSTDPLSDPVR